MSNDMDYKEITRRSYDLVAKDYSERDKTLVAETNEVQAALEDFSSRLPIRASVLDVGSGGGRDSRFFFEKGFVVTGIDFSSEMVVRAKNEEPGIDYRVMDFEAIDFPAGSFDGIWANASLHHIPRNHLPAVLRNLERILKSSGLFFMIVKHGVEEGIRRNKKFGREIERHFSFYQPEELKAAVQRAGFRVLSASLAVEGEWVYLLAQKTEKSLN